LFCSIGLLAHFLTSDRSEIDAHLKDSYGTSISEGKLVNKDQNDANLESNFENKLTGFDSKSDTLNMESGDTVAPEIVSKGGNEKSKPRYDDGQPGMTRAELYSLHENQLAMIERELNDQDAIVIEATDEQPAVTRAQLEALHAEQMQQIQNELNNPNAIVFEATEDQPAVTRRELQVLHAEQKRQMQEELNDPKSIVIESTDGHPPIARGELEALHREQVTQMRQEANNTDAPAIEFEDGTMITNQELAELHEEQMYQIFASQFDGDEIVVEEME